jgi:phosphoribosylformylglycinamidine cyclo-ligase
VSERYAQAGVDIRAGEQAVRLLAPLARSTHGPQVLSEIGAFGGLYALAGFNEPVLVASTDGVGTKLKVAIAMNRHDTIGRDLVALSVNDVLTTGARPLFFLDYIATGKLVPAKIAALVGGMAEECRANGCALLGGETAEMPDLYGAEEYDLAGFVVGAVERKKLVDSSKIVPGDLLWGLPSSGLHTNGYTLARQILEGLSLDGQVEELGRPLGEELLEPHRSYVRDMEPLLERGLVKGMAHITGGGLIGNIPRCMPPGLTAELEWGSWPVPPIFELLRRRGDVPLDEMLQVFNMGLGYVWVSAAAARREVERLVPGALLVGAVRSGVGETIVDIVGTP